jgi:hypothetical protein
MTPWPTVIEEHFRPVYMDLTKRDVAKALGKAPGTITRWLKRGVLPFHGSPEDPRFDLLDVIQALSVMRIPRWRARRRR